jgi:hypothetical protein
MYLVIVSDRLLPNPYLLIQRTDYHFLTLSNFVVQVALLNNFVPSNRDCTVMVIVVLESESKRHKSQNVAVDVLAHLLSVLIPDVLIQVSPCLKKQESAGPFISTGTFEPKLSSSNIVYSESRIPSVYET